MSCVYLLRYSNWDLCEWKIGKTNNINNRLKHYVTSNGNLPDVVFCKWDSENEETIYHKKFKNARIDGKREHFRLTNDDIILLTSEGFERYIGTIESEDIVEKLEKLHLEFEQKIQEIRLNTLQTIQKTKEEYEKRIHLLKIKSQTEIEIIENINNQHIKILQKKHQPTENKQLFKTFLEKHTRYKKDNVITINELRNHFSNYIGKKINKVDLGTFYQVNFEYIIEKRDICKNCRNIHKKGCCENYGSKQKTSAYIVKNIELIN